MNGLFSNIPQITKNLLILNVLMFILTLFFQSRGVDLYHLLGVHSFNSPLFEPYQLVSHFFMHGDFWHLLFNMFGLVMFGSILERLWGPKRFMIFYVVSAIGAVVIFEGINTYEVFQMRRELGYIGFDYQIIDNATTYHRLNEIIDTLPPLGINYLIKSNSVLFGASGAVFGIMAGFAILFPNTELQLLFPPIPVKAKYLIGGYFVLEVYRSIYLTAGDNVAHLAHVGGAIVGAIIVLIWRRNRSNFY